MSMRIVTAMALLGAAGVMSGCNIQQPSAGCQVQDATDAPWQAAYILKNPADSSKSCGTLTGEALGVFKYTTPGKANTSVLGIRPQRAAELTARVAEDPSDPYKTYRAATALSSTFPDQPDAKGLCLGAGFNTATVAAPAGTDSKGKPLPAETVSYMFKDMNVYSAPSAPGTQMEGTLVFSDGTGCTAEYRVLALWPQVGCVPGSTKPADNCGEGSGLNPDFDAVCSEDLEACIPNPAKGVPSFR